MNYTFTNLNNSTVSRLNTEITNGSCKKKIALSKLIYTVGWYNINTGVNDTINVVGNLVPYVTLPAGYYNLKTLTTYIQGFIPTFTSSLNAANGQITLNHNQTTFTFQLGFATMLGFPLGTTITAGSPITSTSTPIFNPNQIICVYLDQIQASSNMLNGYNSYLLHTFADTNLPLGTTIEIDINPLKFTDLIQTNINTFTISLRDTSNNPINFNGYNFTAILTIDDK